MAALGLPMILAYILIAADLRTDLSEWSPLPGAPDVLGWRDLATAHPPDWKRVRLLGYMMDGYQAYRMAIRWRCSSLCRTRDTCCTPRTAIPIAWWRSG
jgi:hypothetical protein